MKEYIEFYKCPICGNIIEVIEGNIENITCCSNDMIKLEANSKDASLEKHVPVYEKVEDEIVVKVGEIEHPMEKEHYIMWILQVTENKVTKVKLYPGQETTTRFPYIKSSQIYAYCNKHGLFKNIVK